MVRHSILSPLSVVLAGVLVIALLLAGGADARPDARQHGPTLTPTATPCDPDDPESCDPENATETPTATTNPYPAYEGPGTPTATQSSTAEPADALTPTGTLTGTLVPAPSDTAPSGAPSATAELASTPAPAALPPTPSPTPTPANQLACIPGVPLIITGSAPPRSPLLLYFGQRAVGGGSASATGDFALKLTVGQERAGEYQVSVRVRGTSQVLRELICSVPAVPVPTPLGRR